ncbi:MAG: SEC-C metal-binding domain-containing protein [Trueperaceae bacterium]
MSSAKVGRNEPCPCGSGKKYKKCCLQGNDAAPNDATDLLDALDRIAADREFGSLEELQDVTDRLVEEQNNAPLEDFQGLSPWQMMRLLHFPFESPEVIDFPEVLAVEPSAPIMVLFNLLAEAAGEDGLKATAKGNLPRAFCREAALIYWGEEKYALKTQYGAINKEADFPDLHAMRLTAECAGLLTRRSGRFRLTGVCKRLLKRSGGAGVYPRLLRAYVRKFNWASGIGSRSWTSSRRRSATLCTCSRASARRRGPTVSTRTCSCRRSRTWFRRSMAVGTGPMSNW